MDYALCEYLSEYWILNILSEYLQIKLLWEEHANEQRLWEHISLLIFRIMNDAH